MHFAKFIRCLFHRMNYYLSPGSPLPILRLLIQRKFPAVKLFFIFKAIDKLHLICLHHILL